MWERRKKKRIKSWEIIDVECAWVYYADTEIDKGLFIKFIEGFHHTAFVKEIEL